MATLDPYEITEESFNGCHWNSLMSYQDNPTAALAAIGDALGNIGRLLVQFRDEARVRTDNTREDDKVCRPIPLDGKSPIHGCWCNSESQCPWCRSNDPPSNPPTGEV